ncbi:MAG: radical SAM protein [Pseudomonadota bacterium]
MSTTADKNADGRAAPRMLFLFPPQWTPQNPHFVLTSLTGTLRERGYHVDAVDLNILFYTSILTREALELSRTRALLEHKFLCDKLRLQSIVDDTGLDFQFDGAKADHIEHYVKSHPDEFASIPTLIADALATLRDPVRYYDPEQFCDAMEIVDNALEIYSLPFWPSTLQFNFFEHPLAQLNFEDIVGYVDNEHGNMFINFFERQLPTLTTGQYDVIALSINTFSQVLPGLTLARMLKRAVSPDVHINIGGNFFSRVLDNLRQRPAFFEEFCHSITFSEGERPLSALLDAVAGKRPLDEVPNLLFLTDDGGTVKRTEDGEPEPLETRGFHDLTGLPMYLYLIPDTVLCLEASKGCYWGRCSFCDSFFGVRKDQASIDRVINEIKHVNQKWGVRHFEFTDECMTPQYMEDLADRILAEGLDISWLCNGRLERTFTRERLFKLHQAGLNLVLWGFESGSKRILDLINKGVGFEERWDVLTDAADAGIWNNAYIFFGFPTESKDEADSTVRAISDHTDLIHSYGRSIFTLGKQSILRDEAKNYGIVDILTDDQEFSTNLFFKASAGMSDEESKEFLTQSTVRCAAAYGGAPLWMFLRYREDLHLYIAKHGREYVSRYQVRSRVVSNFEKVW